MSDNTEEALLIEAGRMAARLIHDFKNQIGGMKLYASYLKKRFSDEPEGIEIAEKIIQGLNEMAEHSGLVSKLTRPLELRRQAADLSACLEMTLSGLKLTAEARQVRLLMELPAAALPAIQMDLQQMQAAFTALIARAVEASPLAGEVIVRVTDGEEAVHIEVVDRGESLDDDRLRTLFDPLTNERINRISLGLALARRIVVLHGGDIAATRGATGGTVVDVRLNSIGAA
jgi:signal transduction histidine kinase